MIWILSGSKNSDNLLARFSPAPDFVELRQLLRSPVRLTGEGEGGEEEEQVPAAVEDQACLICLVYSPNKVRKPILVSC